MSGKIPMPKWDFRDVSSGLQKIRQFLLGRKYLFHNRFPPLISPRSIPPPDIPRGPDIKYSDQWYGRRNAMNSVRPPVVAPIPQGIASSKQAQKTKKGGPCYPKTVTSTSDTIEFPCPPTPGMAWWYDGHCYYKTVPEVCKPTPGPPCDATPPCPPTPPCPSPCPEPKKPPPIENEPPSPPAKLRGSSPCGGDEKPPLSPCKKPKPCPPPPPPPAPCDPCKPPKKGLTDFLSTQDKPKKC